MRKIIYVLALLLCVFETKATADTLEHLKAQNERYFHACSNDADISQEIRKHTAEKGQSPFAIVITCSDSRVIPEHIFMAGIGELFVIRTAGNVVGAFERGSVEYGLEHLGAQLVVVLGHSSCGAVAAALGEGELRGDIKTVVEEVRRGIKGEKDSGKAELLNIENSLLRLRESEIIRELEAEGKIKVFGAKYEISTGKVTIAMSDDDFLQLCKKGSPQEVEAAIKAGANVHARERDMTPLLWAAARNPDIEVITVLVNAGADIHARGMMGTTVLMTAAMLNPNPEVITALIDAGADIQAKDTAGNRAVDSAKANNNPAVHQRLTEEMGKR